ncbi:transcriptional regulator [Zoogloea oryzae]|uniref:Transcriptional regulator n=1 Tax=Zoogloea oryzae TaxID=310767 RepID=A0ABQ6FDZ7_9RHOO|nr:cupin domain-containing protein [Zoogloea oryzae]GLT23141.1 transcriptional regulator [Zoogloea oryzae]
MPPSVIHFSDPAPEPVEDRPALGRAIGSPPLRLTAERYAAEDGALSIGDWACEPGAWRIAFHPGRHEFFQVVSGRLRIVDTAGNAREFGPGEAGIIPAGFIGTFEVIERVEKRYVMLDRV